MRTLTRRLMSRFIAGGVASSCLTGLAAPFVWAQSNMAKLRVGYVPVIDTTAFFVAQSQGFFKEERLDVEATPVLGGGPALSALAAAQFELAMATVTSVLLGAAQGFDFRIVTAVAAVGSGPPDEIAALLVRKGGGIKRGSDCQGKRCAVQLLNNLPWLCLRLWIDSTGGSSSKVSIVEVPFPQMSDALLGNRVDLVAINEPFLSAAIRNAPDKVEIAAWSISQTLPNTIVASFNATQEYLDKHGEVVHAFSRAYKKAVDWTVENKGNPVLEELISKFTRLPADQVRSLMVWPKFVKSVDPVSLDTMARAMQRYGLLKSLPDSAQLIYDSARI